jgi:hypothetical protein
MHWIEAAAAVNNLVYPKHSVSAPTPYILRASPLRRCGQMAPASGGELHLLIFS